MTCPSPSDTQQYQLARRRAGAKLGWYIHACAYVLVNLGLMALALSHGQHWAIYPALGWGLGLMMHGIVVWLTSPTSPFWQRLVDQELQAMRPSNSDH